MVGAHGGRRAAGGDQCEGANWRERRVQSLVRRPAAPQADGPAKHSVGWYKEERREEREEVRRAGGALREERREAYGAPRGVELLVARSQLPLKLLDLPRIGLGGRRSG